jgi:hypothetical protein
MLIFYRDYRLKRLVFNDEVYNMIMIPEQAVDINDDSPVRTEVVSSNDKPLPVSALPAHCHVPDDKFDYGARNRLIIVLILCIIFMIIEIIGMCFCVGF